MSRLRVVAVVAGKSWLYWLGIGIAVLALGGGGWALLHPTGPLLAASPSAAKATSGGGVPALTVGSSDVHRSVWPRALEASGSIAAWQEAVVGARVGGLTVAEVRVNVGDVVKRGQVLARLDTALLRADEAQLQAAVTQAMATLAQGEVNSKRAQSLKASGGISEQDILASVTTAATARAQVASAKAMLSAKALQLDYGAVRSPDAGTISSRSVTVGTVASVGQELFRVIVRDRLEWRGELTAVQLAQVRGGQSVALTLPDGTLAAARIRQAGPSLNDKTRLATIYADVEPGGAARANMYAAARIDIGQSAALIVPAVSVVIRDGRNYLFVLRTAADVSRVAMRAVSVGRRHGAEVEIVSGLDGSERVVTEGAGFLADGDLVRVANSATVRPDRPLAFARS